MASSKNPRNSESSAAKQEWRQHELVDKLLPEPSQQQSLSLLLGFPAKSPVEGYRRLYLDLVLGRCVDILEEDIVHTESIDKSAFRPTAVWVRADSKLQYRNVTSYEIQAGFLGGRIARENLASAARSHPSIASRAMSVVTHKIFCHASNAHTSCSDACGVGVGVGGGGDLTDDQCFIITEAGTCGIITANCWG